MNDLSRIFIEKFKSFDLRSHQNRSYFSQSFDIRQFSQSCFSIVSKKSYLIIENLFEMFDDKFKKKIYFRVKTTFLFEYSQIKRESSLTSNLQSIRSCRLIKIQKVQNRKVWINTCLRNSFALIATNALKNRSFYHTKCQTSFILNRNFFAIKILIKILIHMIFAYIFVVFSIFVFKSSFLLHLLRSIQLQ